MLTSSAAGWNARERFTDIKPLSVTIELPVIVASLEGHVIPLNKRGWQTFFSKTATMYKLDDGSRLEPSYGSADKPALACRAHRIALPN